MLADLVQLLRGRLGHVAVLEIYLHIVSRLSCPRETESGLPDAVIAEFEEIDLCHGWQHQGPRPTVLVQIKKGAFSMGQFGNLFYWRHSLCENGLVIDDEDRSQGVAFLANREDFILRVSGDDEMILIHHDRFLSSVFPIPERRNRTSQC